ncbi:hypothetical protein F2P56_004782 [Juglans regia]|uniref:Uncharacterized protein LOC109004176 n=2 Tax=Juglans regia TaxID=51240 RepID=A0A2I4G2U4_JUGRE|nr:uncharacterized protein LOC109004176 [Juglans regia]KAF5478200.1 hypothetical protein F2P56_004782 [Juglans regia]
MQMKEVSSSDGSPVSTIKKWKKPEEGWLKANFDTAIYEQNITVGLGIIIRNSKREVMVAYSEPLRMDAKAVVVEALAMRRIIGIYIEMGFRRVVFEGDALVIINAVKGEAECWTWYSQIVEDVKKSLRELLYWKINFVRREGNEIAHKFGEICFKIR